MKFGPDSLVFIDAYNLLYKIDGLSSLLDRDPGAARTLLYRELLQLNRLQPEQLRVVVDGARLPDEEVPPQLPVIWAVKPESADDKILRLILREVRKARKALEIVLVSDDSQLRDRIRQRGGKPMYCNGFLLEELSGKGEQARSNWEAEQGPRQAEDSGRRKGVSIRKGGGTLRDEELEYWMNQFGDDEDDAMDTPETPLAQEGSDDFDKDPSQNTRSREQSNPVPRRRRGSGKRGVDDDLARWLGVDAKDGRIYGDDEDLDFDEEDD